MSVHPAGRRACARASAFVFLLAASPLALATASAQSRNSGQGEATTLEEIAVSAEGNGTGAAAPRAAAPTPVEKPVGQIVTAIGRDGPIENRAATTIGDVLRESPGVTVRQGNGPRDVIISIRGNNARSTGVSRNMVVSEDGFPVTQADGASRFDLTDPRAYSRIDVFRGPQSALFGNFATGGALNFQTRRGAEINGLEYGSEAGSFGYLNNYLTFGGVSGPFEYSLFTSDARGDGYISHNNFNTQTINFLGTYTPTPDNRFTLKVINNTIYSALPGRLSFNQFRANPFQHGCATARFAAPGCATYNLLLNGVSGATVPVTADEGAFLRQDRRTIVGARWEHDLDAQTTFRTQFVYDMREIDQPFYTTSNPGHYPGFAFQTDVTRRTELFGLPVTGYAALSYNTLETHGNTFNRIPYGGPRLGALAAQQNARQSNLGGRLRAEVQLSEQWSAVAGLSIENTTIKGYNVSYAYNAFGRSGTLANADRDFLNVAPEFALTYRPSEAWQFRGRVATGYSTPTAGNLFVTPAGVPGNNTDLKTQENLGFDLGADWTPVEGVRIGVTGFYEFFRNELISQSPGAGLMSYTFNAPASEHRGVEVAGDWRFAEGWKATLAYTFDDQIYTDYTEQLSAGALTARFDRAGNKIPGVPTNQVLARIGYDQKGGTFDGLGAYVEAVYQDGFFVDNANQFKLPGYTIVNANIHYQKDFADSYVKRLNLFVEARNIFDETYIVSGQNLANSISGTSGLQNGAAALAATQGSIFAGAPRNFVGGVKLSFCSFSIR